MGKETNSSQLATCSPYTLPRSLLNQTLHDHSSPNPSPFRINPHSPSTSQNKTLVYEIPQRKAQTRIVNTETMKIPENFQMQAEPYTSRFAISESEQRRGISRKGKSRSNFEIALTDIQLARSKR